MQGTMGHALYTVKNGIPHHSVMSRSSDKGKGNFMDQILPPPPLVEFVGNFRSRQPNEIRIGKMFTQVTDGITRQIGSKHRLKIGDNETRVMNQIATPRCPRFGIRKILMRFKRIARSDQPPHGIQPQIFQRNFRIVDMTFMRGIERASQQPYPQSRPAASVK